MKQKEFYKDRREAILAGTGNEDFLSDRRGIPRADSLY